jgi:hypothetical protein
MKTVSDSSSDSSNNGTRRAEFSAPDSGALSVIATSFNADGLAGPVELAVLAEHVFAGESDEFQLAVDVFGNEIRRNCAVVYGYDHNTSSTFSKTLLPEEFRVEIVAVAQLLVDEGVGIDPSQRGRVEGSEGLYDALLSKVGRATVANSEEEIIEKPDERSPSSAQGTTRSRKVLEQFLDSSARERQQDRSSRPALPTMPDPKLPFNAGDRVRRGDRAGQSDQ